MKNRTKRPILLKVAVPLGAGLLTFGVGASAADGLETSTSIETTQCLERQFREAPPGMTMRELRDLCSRAANPEAQSKAQAAPQEDPNSLILARMRRERAIEGFRSSLTPHNRNYMIPVSYVDSPNEAPFAPLFPPGNEGIGLDNVEAKFQLSVKATLLENIFRDDASLYFGFTATSFWQVYNNNVSSPFRETIYEPELFWAAPLEWRPFNTDASLIVLGYSHQSNGQGGSLSRSWNRLYANFIWEKNDFVFSLKPWYRIPERDKAFPGDPSGDDNPDIEEYMGNFEFGTAYRRGDHEFTLMVRNNLRSDNHGAVQMEWTFPLLRRVRGYAQYFNGYGESLIDYNARIERLGIGILLTDLL